MAVSYEFDAFVLPHYLNNKRYVITTTINGLDEDGDQLWDIACDCDMDTLEQPTVFKFTDEDNKYELRVEEWEGDFVWSAFKNGEAIAEDDFSINIYRYKSMTSKDEIFDMLEYPKEDSESEDEKEEDKSEEESKCENCECILHENVSIECISKGEEEQTWCMTCWNDLGAEMRAEGWVGQGDEEDEEED